MPVINAGSTYRLKYKIDNKSGHQAKNIDLSLKLLDEAKAPLVLENYYDMDRFISVINGNDSEEVVFDVKIGNLAPEGIHPLKLRMQYENAFGNQFTSEETVYIRVANNNRSPIITVESINVKKSGAASDVITLELKLKNLGNLRADDVKVTLGGLRTDGYSLHNTTDVRYIDLIYGNGSATVSYDLLPPASGAAGSNELNVSFEYRDSAGNKYSEQNKIFVPVGEGEGTRPNITFEQIAAPNEAVGVGREFSVSFNLKNNGGASARNVKVTMNTDAGIVIRSMNPVYFTGIDGSKSEKVTYKLFASEDAATKNYPISLNVEYEDVLGNRYNATQYIGVFVENDAGKTVPRIIISNYTIDPFPVNAGSEFSLKMSFLNTNKTVDVSNIKVTVLSEDGTFTPTDSGNTFYIESIPRTQSVERELVLQAKPDAEQKSYMLTVNFEYEDEKGNPYTAKESISVRVLQSPRLVTGDISMMTETFVGQPVSVYLDFYNMGKSTLYNLMVSV
ncbi:MAG TPA: CARDB domain-containing protein, partial [Clostridiales bacterium]|nr:CARDB domain-containing protein [Clostridiales bacterium]